MKTRYFTVTQALLTKLRACTRGLRWADELVPVVLSTNPEENLLAAEAVLYATDYAWDQLTDVTWLESTLRDRALPNKRHKLMDPSSIFEDDHLFPLMQALARIAEWGSLLEDQ